MSPSRRRPRAAGRGGGRLAQIDDDAVDAVGKTYRIEGRPIDDHHELPVR